MEQQFSVEKEYAGQRFDVALTELLQTFSRSRIKRLIEDGHALLDGKVATAKTKLRQGQHIVLHKVTLTDHEAIEDHAQDIPLNVVYEDEQLIVINKPPDLVVHPGAGQPNGTLVNALLHYREQQQILPRAGIVHRLDKMTSGLLVIAKDEVTRQYLIHALKRHEVQRIYHALVRGNPISGATIEARIGRHPKQRKKMAVLVTGGKPATTHYRIMKRFVGYTQIEAKLETGRTHQIRVHMAYKGFPVVGDQVYSGRMALPKGINTHTTEAVLQFKRQALHAAKLGLIHPIKKRPISWRAPHPNDLKMLIANMTPLPQDIPWEYPSYDEEAFSLYDDS